MRRWRRIWPRLRQPESFKRLLVLLALGAMLVLVMIMGATLFTR